MKTLREKKEKETSKEAVMRRMANTKSSDLKDEILLLNALIILSKDWLERHAK